MADITGTAGIDTLDGTNMDDIIMALAGDDTINLSEGEDEIDGGTGFDILLFNAVAQGYTGTVNVSFNALTNELTSLGFSSISTLTGIEQINIITHDGSGGIAASDNIIDLRGFFNVAQIFTYGGDDIVYTPTTNTYVQTGEGADTVFITGANNVIFGEGGDDTFVLTEGTGLNNQISGGAGFDTLDVRQITEENVIPFGLSGGDFEQILGSEINEAWFGGAEDNIFYGNGGDDVLRTQGGDDQIFGGAGDDILEGGSGIDMIDGGEGLDRVSFDLVRDTATEAVVADLRTQTILNDGFGNTETLVSIEGLGAGTRFADTFDGDDNDNVLFAGTGDIVRGHGGDDTFVIQSEGTAGVVDGGSGNDTLSLIRGFQASWTQGAIIDLETGMMTSQNAPLSFTGFENVNGTEFGDEITGSSGANLLQGLGGNDRLIGGGGNDTLNGGDGNDTLEGGAQNDVLDGGAGRDVLNGGLGVDILNGGAGNDLVLGGNRNDIAHGDAGNDRVFGGNGDDDVFGDIGADILRGGAGNDDLLGGNGNDRIFGGTGIDQMFGGSGDDIIDGRGGFDQIIGGAGDDILTGGFNADRFIFADGFGNDIITDFAATSNPEKIDLSGVSAITDFADLLANHLSQSGSDALIDDGLGNTITLTGVDINDLDAFDFVF